MFLKVALYIYLQSTKPSSRDVHWLAG